MEKIKGWGGRPCPDVLPVCKYDVPFSDDHHLFHPSYDYEGPTEKAFRNLEVNIVRGMCRCLHDLEHLKRPPEKPSFEVMKQVVKAERAKR